VSEPIFQELIDAVKAGEITTRDQLQRRKIQLCGAHKLVQVPSNSEILACVNDEDRDLLEPFLIKKPMRTASGVAVVAVMTSPHPCPHGKCIYCPGGVESGSPQSYTGKEPAARRGERNGFDPFSQVRDRIEQLTAIGHKTDKIDLIIMGGTFTSRDMGYQEWFVRRCLDAMNGFDSEALEDAQRSNETARHRCIGLTVETRPDLTDEGIERFMRLGATRVELGVQILDDEILESVGRDHTVQDIRDATQRCKSHGLKVCYHVMPGLPGSNAHKDLECFERTFSDEGFRPDMLKFYPTLVIEGTRLHEMWVEGEYVPYDTETAVDLLSRMKSIVPEYVRIQRIQRDIPAPEIAAGILQSNIRQLVAERMGNGCRCIRCREVGHVQGDPRIEDMGIVERAYEASDGEEMFISFESGHALAGYVRLRLDDIATIRELKVFGKTVAIGEHAEEWQHKGLGKRLISIAEERARANGKTMIRVTSGVGVREYYRSLGYRLERPYMVKTL